jgi:hypothetical protein
MAVKIQLIRPFLSQCVCVSVVTCVSEVRKERIVAAS